MPKILCVAEKPSVAKEVAIHLSGGRYNTRESRVKYIKNYEFDFDFGGRLGHCEVTMTSVVGHLQAQNFTPEYKNWQNPPPQALFTAPILTSVDNSVKLVAENIRQRARGAKTLYIWTDCDREGEYIGSEIRSVAHEVNPRMEVIRAKFSNVERGHVIHAAKNPIALDENQVNAVAARIELDLRIGAAFTRMQCLSLQTLSEEMSKKMMSYGSCQFPTLGFVVERYFRVKNFVPEPFWSITVKHRRDNVDVNFSWERVRLFDRMAAVILFERCLLAKTAVVKSVQTKPTTKWRPLPLTTVELQKLGSRFLGMTSQKVLKMAEDLYTKGFISYPRTETNQFEKNIDLRALVQKQTPDPGWGDYATNLLDGGAFRTPRMGRNNDKAHPPIHPIAWVAATALPSIDHKKVYDLVSRRFLACCSDDAKGQTTTISIRYGEENFQASGLRVLERNYLDVYPFDKWESSQELPEFTEGETFIPTEANLVEGKTSPPSYITEPELLGLMDVNGIGTDATMAEHIEKIVQRDYVYTRSVGGRGRGAPNQDDHAPPDAGRGRGRGRGRGGSRGGRGGTNAPSNRASGGGIQEFIPTSLGIALVTGYDKMDFSTPNPHQHHQQQQQIQQQLQQISLSKPFLRKEMESKMKMICDGRTSKEVVVRETIDQYRQVFDKIVENIEVLRDSCRREVLGIGA